MKVLIATDAWRPQVNGVVRTFERVCHEAPYFDASVDVMGPSEWSTVPLPTYSEIRLALCSYASVARRIEEAAPDYIHIATEGPLGARTRKFCLRNGVRFTTSYHTKFPEYLRARLPVPTALSYRWLAGFHNAGEALMVTNESLRRELTEKGFNNIVLWSRGVDSELYHPDRRSDLGLKGPVFLYVGRVAVEKNLDAFLSLDLPGTKVVTGGGPQFNELKRRYPDVVFTGIKVGEELAEIYASADVFVFPSKTDTFGMVLLEALASGTPVAAFPVTGPRDVIGDADCGVLDDDLQKAALQALEIPRETCRAFAEKHTWRQSIGDFVNNLRIAHDSIPLAVDRSAA